jgi:hypothetical protein
VACASNGRERAGGSRTASKIGRLFGSSILHVCGMDEIVRKEDQLAKLNTACVKACKAKSKFGVFPQLEHKQSLRKDGS